MDLPPGGRGAARCLVFLHGMTADHTLFEKQLEFFYADFTVLAWDAPAHGRSRPTGTRPMPTPWVSWSGYWPRRTSPGRLHRAVHGRLPYSEFPDAPPRRRWRALSVSTPVPTGRVLLPLRPVVAAAGGVDVPPLPPENTERSIAKAAAVTGYARENMLRARALRQEELCRLMGLGFAGFLEENRDLRITCPVVPHCRRTGRHRKRRGSTTGPGMSIRAFRCTGLSRRGTTPTATIPWRSTGLSLSLSRDCRNRARRAAPQFCGNFLHSGLARRIEMVYIRFCPGVRQRRDGPYGGAYRDWERQRTNSAGRHTASRRGTKGGAGPQGSAGGWRSWGFASSSFLVVFIRKGGLPRQMVAAREQITGLISGDTDFRAAFVLAGEVHL